MGMGCLRSRAVFACRRCGPGLRGERDRLFVTAGDEVSLGLGRYSETWPVRELPHPDSIDWKSFREIPTGLVTGTNGKTTTVRLAAHILRASGRSDGMSSTDYIAVKGEAIDRDDWSGPGGART